MKTGSCFDLIRSLLVLFESVKNKTFDCPNLKQSRGKIRKCLYCLDRPRNNMTKDNFFLIVLLYIFLES